MNDPKDLMDRLSEMDPGWVQKKNLDLGALPTLQRQREILATVEAMLKEQLRGDLDQLEQARLNLAKLRRGGGQ